MKFGSVCSGIEAASAAWGPLGMRASWLAEIDPFCNAVLRHHHPDVPNLGDITSEDFCERARKVGSIDVLVGGTPCQSFSTSGKRKGLSDPRGNLTLRFLEILGEIRPTWFVWENVPGVLTDDGGRTFGTVLGKMAKLGYGLAYRVLDSQYFGVAQRRRRVFVVGHSREARLAHSVLFEPQGQGRGAQADRQVEEDTARPTGAGPEGVVYSFYHHTGLDQAFQKDISPPITVGSTLEGVANAPAVAYCLHSDALGRSGKAVTPSADAEGRVRLRPPGVGVLDGDLSYTLAASNPHAIAYQCHGGKVGPMGTLRKGDGGLTSGVPFVLDGPVVRRLTPLECERLQGFPDNHTLVPWKGRAGKNIEEVCNHLSYLLGRKVSADEARELAADAPRYKSVGNSMTVNVMRWIGVRLKAAHEGGS